MAKSDTPLEEQGFFSREGSNRLEPELQEAYKEWRKQPGLAQSSNMLSLLQPTIDKAISAHVGKSDPLLRSRARRMALDALPNYDPQRAKLSTHVISQLQGLKRVSRQQTQVLKLPERIALDQSHLRDAEAEMELDLGRAPSTAELADRTGLSLARLAQMRNYQTARPEGSYAAGGEGDNEGGFDPAILPPPTKLHLELTYADLAPVNQKILEWTLGLHGQKRLTNQQIATKLGLTPGAISQRKERIQALLDREKTLFPF